MLALRKINWHGLLRDPLRPYLTEREKVPQLASERQFFVFEEGLVHFRDAEAKL
jgi:hypothetical protein